ncbi:translation initiation factor IF-2 [Enterococcus raffinosus]|uniref:Translation initiation factor IF-2 n=1 Tax=Enterococcus raffinosus TaxID=71452 RepID=A0AAW8T4Y0_9ENTE|nr:translation initiation factor IF-2 [Enterococcus raffinosus]MDT2522366.1 translation initiation factor IF-2 [Enterococcus raffinosus]MDT2531530.1 translation initiation factor IF-2 [Enterococcus raffinosus]MDT2533718.1 translation initiation factor IF-2 [Enterococcus raffinosus]MDT2543050.1 translation initiation factor IF-2 [Enterococcus raffinosus]MDT2553255.1 translation initiation factor IF-2 [Enterococcus raffinosus]
MGKKRVYEFAKEVNQSSKDVVEKAQTLGIDVNNHMGSLSGDDESKLKQAFSSKTKQTTQAKPSANQHEKPKFHGKSSKNNPNFQNRKGNKDLTQNNRQNNSANANRSNQGQRPNQGSTNNTQRQNQGQRPAQGGANNAQRQNQGQRPAQGGSNNAQRQNQGQRPAQGGANNAQRQNQGQRPAQGGSNNAQRQNQGQRPAQGGANNAQRQNQGQRPAQGGPNNAQRQNQGQRPAQGGANNAQRSNQGGSSTQGGNQNRNKNNYGNQNRNNNFGGNQNRNKNKFNKKGKKGKHQQSQKPAVPPRKFRELPEILEYTEGMNVADIAKKIHREPAEIIKKLFMMGVMVNQNQPLDKDTIELLATDYGIEPQEKVTIDIADIDRFFDVEEANEENLVSRPPVVTIMGHVDHGKTTLLDTLRHSRVTSGEAGGITQHIGAYQIDIDGKPITFLDTPGHAAFTSMRARGASITDITILVVAADDGVMPQTIEAINHAKAAKVPIIVAVNKIDKPGANPQHVMQELSEYELIPEAWGGDTIFVEISAKFNQNIDELLEMILLVAEVEDLKADPTQHGIGTVIEARLDKGKGPVATLLVQQGTMRVGDPIVVGNTYGRVRVMTNDIGRREKAAGPATPVEITGLNDVPQAGDRFAIFDDEKTARAAGEERAKRALLEHRSASARVTLDNLFESLKEGELKEVNVIIKADVQGSAEALAASLKKIDVEGVRVKIVHSAVGAINESDVTLAAASNAIIIGFNVRPTPQAKQQASTEEVDIRLHRIIYKAIEEIETAMKGLLDPEYEEKITGQMTVRETYKVSKVGTIAGCYVNEGSIQRDSGVRIIRDGIVILEGKLASLKRFKDDVKEVKMGYECGAMIENFNDIKVDDVIEGFIMEEIKPK